MNKGDRAAWTVLAVTVIGSAMAFHAMWPNSGQMRFRDDTITVNAEQAKVWGADPARITDWGVPVEFVKGEADVVFTIGETACQEVPGFGRGCVEGEAEQFGNSRNWTERCHITLRVDSSSTPDARTATVVHEFGHCLGQDHVNDEDSIMGSVLPSKDFTPEHYSFTVTDMDRARVHSLYTQE